MKSAAVIRQRIAVRPSVPSERPQDFSSRGPKLDFAERAMLRHVACRMVLSRRSGR